MYGAKVGLGLGLRRPRQMPEALVEGFDVNPWLVRVWDTQALTAFIATNTENVYIKIRLFTAPEPTAAAVKAAPDFTCPAAAHVRYDQLLHPLDPDTEYFADFVAASSSVIYPLYFRTWLVRWRAHSSGLGSGFL